MLAIGSTVDAEVESVQGFGVWLKASGYKILVLITHIADTREATRAAMESFVSGQAVKVRIEGFVDSKNYYTGSLKGIANTNAAGQQN
jgi:ribosomal protein S1